MNIAKLKYLAAALVLVAFVSGCNRSEAPDASSATPAPAVETTPGTPTATPTPDAAMAPEAEATPVVIPGTADAIWQAIDEHSAELKSTIESGSLGEVHQHAFAIRDLVAALPAHSPTLPAEDQAKLEGEVKFVATLASRLDETGDAVGSPGTELEFAL